MTTDQDRAAEIRKNVTDAAAPLLGVVNNAAKEGFTVILSIGGEPVAIQKIDVLKKL